MALLRAFTYFLSEALTSLWRSRLVNAVSIGTIAVSLFVLGAFLTVASALSGLVTRWTETVQVIVYLEDGDAGARARRASRTGCARTRRSRRFEFVTPRAGARALPRDVPRPELAAGGPRREPVPGVARGEPASRAAVGGRGRAAGEGASTGVPGVREIQYDLLWIERLSTGVRLVRVVGAFLGGILVLAAVFTISNVIRLTIYAREDELDIMRLVGATRAYVKGPFVAEGVIQGGLGGLAASFLLWTALAWLSRDLAGLRPAAARDDRAVARRSPRLLVAGGMAVGLVGSLMSLSRLEV